ncbi:hypothetical protein BD560DRAFT_421353 [Blakeslea trispora]|nr:hypothetical protein BD560DRAFT_421353 [Blakeslea trispora]
MIKQELRLIDQLFACIWISDTISFIGHLMDHCVMALTSFVFVAFPLTVKSLHRCFKPAEMKQKHDHDPSQLKLFVLCTTHFSDFSMIRVIECYLKCYNVSISVAQDISFCSGNGCMAVKTLTWLTLWTIQVVCGKQCCFQRQEMQANLNNKQISLIHKGLRSSFFTSDCNCFETESKTHFTYQSEPNWIGFMVERSQHFSLCKVAE